MIAMTVITATTVMTITIVVIVITVMIEIIMTRVLDPEMTVILVMSVSIVPIDGSGNDY